jgi:hypothetical protein
VVAAVALLGAGALGAAPAPPAGPPAPAGAPALLRAGTYLVASGKPGKIKEKFKVTREGAVVTSVADAIHPAGRNLHVVTRTDATTGALLDMTVELHAKTLPERTLHATVAAGHVHLVDDSRGTDSKTPLKIGALPLFIDPGGLLAHHLTLLTQRYDWAKGGEQIFWVYNPGFAEMRVRVAHDGDGEGKLGGKKRATHWLTFTSSEIATMRIEVDGDDGQVLRVVGPKGEELVLLEGWAGAAAPESAPAAAAMPTPPAPGAMPPGP